MQILFVMMVSYKRILIFICLGGLSCIASCSSKGSSTPPEKSGLRGPTEVEGFIVRARNVSDKIEVPGSLLPAEQTQIKSEVSGRVIQINFNEGSRVERGALLVKLFDSDLQ